MSTSVSSVVSHFPDAENGFTTTTSGSVSSGATTVGLNSVAGYTNGMPAVFVIDPTNSKKQTFTGIIDTSGVQVTSVVWTAGTNTAHDSGATVVDYATATHIAMVSKGLLVEHTQAGRHSMTSPKVTTGINDSNNNELIKFTATASAVNEVTLTNGATGSPVTLTTTGGDTNIGLTVTPKGTGALTLNNVYNPYKFRVHRAAAQDTVAGTPEKVKFDTADFDTNSNYATSSTFRYTAPVNGFYFFNANVEHAASNQGLLYLYKNGSVMSIGGHFNTGANTQAMGVADFVQLTAGDYIEVFIVTDNTVALTVSAGLWPRFTGFLVSRT